tara:strand:+ start:113 stop:385 length:273 start_codon:yes stop_codon:yes gene_type:complete
MPIGVNIPKAKELQKERFRQVRKPLLDALDIDYQRADEAGDASKKTEIATKKQALRDVTNNTALNDATSEAEVRAVWDASVLGERPAEHT